MMENEELIKMELDVAIGVLLDQELETDFVFSPVSIQLAIAIGHSASAGKYQQAMRDATLVSLNAQTYKDYYHELMTYIKDSGDGVQVNIANRVYYPKQLQPIEETRNEIRRLYEAEMHGIEAVQKHTVVDRLNEFFNENHNNVPRHEEFNWDMFSSEHRNYVIASSLAFTGKWRSKLGNRERTKKEISDRMICHRGILRFAETNFFRFISLPYEDTNYTMNYFIPKVKGFALRSVCESIKSEMIIDLMKKAEGRMVDLSIPEGHLSSTIRPNTVFDLVWKRICKDRDGPGFQYMELERLLNNKSVLSAVAHSAIHTVTEYGTGDEHVEFKTPVYTNKTTIRALEIVVDDRYLFIVAKGFHPIIMGGCV